MKIAILGAAGRMGTSLLRCAGKIKDCEVVAAVEHAEHPVLGKQVSEMLAGSLAAHLDNLTYTANWNNTAEVIIDFSLPLALKHNLAKATANSQAYVLGTTGLDPELQQTIKDSSASIPMVWAPNMSLGVNLMLELVNRTAAVLGPDYDAEIIDIHHGLKKDAPSGTALNLAAQIAAARDKKLEDVVCYGRSGIVGERPQGEIAIHALRGGSVIGDHTVMFMADVERIELTHKANSRDAFAMGALRAAQWLVKRSPGLYNMRHVLGFENPECCMS